MGDLTNKQRIILKNMAIMTMKNFRPPTIRELCEIHNISSPNGIMCHIQALIKKGYVTNPRDEKSRSYHVKGLEYMINLEDDNGKFIFSLLKD